MGVEYYIVEMLFEGGIDLKERYKSFFITTIFYLLSYSLMLYPHYSPDSFAYHENRIANSDGTGNLALGRFGNYLVGKVVAWFDFDCIESQLFCTLFLILCLSFATEIICLKFDKLYKNDIQRLIGKIAVVLSFCNVFLLEWFVFVEATFQWAFSVIFMALAFMQVRKDFAINRIIFCVLFQSISLGFYQATIGYFVIFSLLWVYVYSNGTLNKESILLNVKALLCGAVAGMSNLFLIKIMQIAGCISETSRTGQIGIQTILHNIASIYNNLDYLVVRNFGLFPPRLLIVFVVVSYVLIVYFMVKTDTKNLLNKFIYLLLLVICCRVIVYFPHIVASEVWMAQRTIVSFWTIISMPAIVICTLNGGKFLERISLAIIGIILFFNIVYIQFISANVIANNKIDEEISYCIYNKIVEYEEETGIKVDKISLCWDESVSYGHDSIHYKTFDLNRRAHSVGWACIQCINFYNNQSYHGSDFDLKSEIYEENFAGKDWNRFDIEEQLVFVDDVLYLVVY